jgi:polyisoprenoid-binding protein YceI
MSVIESIARRSSLAFAAAFVIAGAAAAQEAPKWVVDHATSELGFDSSAEGQQFHGHFEKWDADIRFDPKNLGGSKVVVTVETGSIASGDGQRDQTAQSGEWFSSAVFPKATFTATSFKDLGGGRYEADGDLNIRGKSLPLALPFSLTINGDQAKMSGQATIDRSTFDIGKGDYGGADVVPLEVGIKVELTASRAK